MLEWYILDDSSNDEMESSRTSSALEEAMSQDNGSTKYYFGEDQTMIPTDSHYGSSYKTEGGTTWGDGIYNRYTAYRKIESNTGEQTVEFTDVTTVASSLNSTGGIDYTYTGTVLSETANYANYVSYEERIQVDRGGATTSYYYNATAITNGSAFPSSDEVSTSSSAVTSPVQLSTTQYSIETINITKTSIFSQLFYIYTTNSSGGIIQTTSLYNATGSYATTQTNNIARVSSYQSVIDTQIIALATILECESDEVGFILTTSSGDGGIYDMFASFIRTTIYPNDLRAGGSTYVPEVFPYSVTMSEVTIASGSYEFVVSYEESNTFSSVIALSSGGVLPLKTTTTVGYENSFVASTYSWSWSSYTTAGIVTVSTITLTDHYTLSRKTFLYRDDLITETTQSDYYTSSTYTSIGTIFLGAYETSSYTQTNTAYTNDDTESHEYGNTGNGSGQSVYENGGTYIFPGELPNFESYWGWYNLLGRVHNYGFNFAPLASDSNNEGTNIGVGQSFHFPESCISLYGRDSFSVGVAYNNDEITYDNWISSYTYAFNRNTISVTRKTGTGTGDSTSFSVAATPNGSPNSNVSKLSNDSIFGADQYLTQAAATMTISKGCYLLYKNGTLSAFTVSDDFVTRSIATGDVYGMDRTPYFVVKITNAGNYITKEDLTYLPPLINGW